MSTSAELQGETLFRVHMQADQVDIVAATAAEARVKATELRPGARITKVKVLKEEQA